VCDVPDQPPASPPAAWIKRHAPLIATGGTVLDLAAGSGRHSRFLAARGHPVVALDRDVSRLPEATAGFEVIAADLEDGSPWPLAGRHFAAIVVTNYLHRPILPNLAAALAPGGILLYETFQQGNERFGKPSNPAFLLASGELLDFAVASGLTVLGYFSGTVRHPRGAVIQALAARAPR